MFYEGVRCVTEIPRFIKMMDKVYKILTLSLIFNITASLVKEVSD